MLPWHQHHQKMSRTYPEPSNSASTSMTHPNEQQRQPAQNTIALSTMQQPKKGVAIRELLISPPEQAPYDSFLQTSEPSQMVTQVNLIAATKPRLIPQQTPASPPISPLTKVSNHVNTAVHDVKDPILYPEVPTSPARPLFERRLSPEAQHAVSKHMAARQVAPLPAGVRPPKRQDYELFLCFHEIVYNKFFSSSPAKQNEWLRREKAQLLEDAKARNGGRAKAAHRPIIRAKPLMARPSETIVAKADLAKSATGPRNATKVVKPATSRPVRVNASSKPSRPRSGSTPQPETKRQTTGPDQDFESIPDFCPPLSTLTPSNVMKTPAANNARDFKEEELHLLPLLHPDEQQVASNLRLDPATYLASKRRIFLQRLIHYHQGKPFRKTHAQGACRIDVNKASKLHTAFDGVGWFDEKWVRDVAMPTNLDV